jgi:hypothetical protein
LDPGSRCKGDFFVAVMDTADHLLRKEGIDGMAEAENSESCWKSQHVVARSDVPQELGTGFGD